MASGCAPNIVNRHARPDARGSGNGHQSCNSPEIQPTAGAHGTFQPSANIIACRCRSSLRRDLGLRLIDGEAARTEGIVRDNTYSVTA